MNCDIIQTGAARPYLTDDLHGILFLPPDVTIWQEPRLISDERLQGTCFEMDAKDVRIFCEMGFKFPDYNRFSERHVSPSEIGNKLGLDEKTVRVRVKKMEEEGFIKYYEAIPNLALFGTKSVEQYAFEAPDIPSKEEALGYFRTADRIVDITDFLGPLFGASLAGASHDQIQVLTNEIVEKLKLKRGFKMFERTPIEPASIPQKLDWQIMLRLRYDALCPAKDIAEEISITDRMVEYRISKLLESRAFYIRAIINQQRQEGVIFYGLNLFVDPEKQDVLVKEFKETYQERFWSLWTPMSGLIILNLFALNLGEPEETLKHTLQLKGVKQGSMVIFKELVESERPNWIDELIEKKIAELGT